MNFLGQVFIGVALCAGILALIAFMLWLIVEIHINYHNIYGGSDDPSDRD